MASKQYGTADDYERKLIRVMERLGVPEGKYSYNWDRFCAWIEFFYKGQLYRFDHSLEKAKARGINMRYGSDVFAQLVLALEDLARMAERGIYELQTWLAGMKYLPPPVVVPECIKALGFVEIPASTEEVQARFKTLAKQVHPDVGGSEEAFIKLQEDTRQAIAFVEGRK